MDSRRSRTWTRVTVTPAQLRRHLQARHWLHLHALCLGTLTLGLMLLISMGLLAAGVQHLALRYALTLSAGYLLYLGLVRLWAECMIRRAFDGDPSDALPDLGGSGGSGKAELSGQGGDFGGGGASGSWDAQLLRGDLGNTAGHATSDAASGLLDGAGDALGHAAGEALGAADEGIVVLVPVLAVFGALLGMVFGAGWLMWLVFSTELLLAVAVELAFALLLARTLYQIEREGWLLAALRLSWKPLLGALLCAVLVGLLIDIWLPGAHTAREAWQLWRGL